MSDLRETRWRKDNRTTRVRLAPFTGKYSGGFFAREKCKNVRLRILPGYNRVLKRTSSALQYLDIPNNPGILSHSYSFLQWTTITLLVKFHMGQQILLENSLVTAR